MRGIVSIFEELAGFGFKLKSASSKGAVLRLDEARD
jgi:hypothetical protein